MSSASADGQVKASAGVVVSSLLQCLDDDEQGLTAAGQTIFASAEDALLRPKVILIPILALIILGGISHAAALLALTLALAATVISQNARMIYVDLDLRASGRLANARASSRFQLKIVYPAFAVR